MQKLKLFGRKVLAVAILVHILPLVFLIWAVIDPVESKWWEVYLCALILNTITLMGIFVLIKPVEKLIDVKRKPIVIETEEEYQKALKRIDTLLEEDTNSELSALSAAVIAYEDIHYPIEKPDMSKIPVSFIVEETGTGYSAYAEEYPVFTTGDDLAKLRMNALDAINSWFEDKGLDEINSSQISFFEKTPVNI